MGGCLRKTVQSPEDCYSVQQSSEPRRRSDNGDSIDNNSHQISSQRTSNSRSFRRFSGSGKNKNNSHSSTDMEDIVNQLVRETLAVIGTIVDNESELPGAMVKLHSITEIPSGWIQLVKSLIEVVPTSHVMGASVITLLLDDSPLPTKESVLEVAKMVSNFKHDFQIVHKERNFCIILGCLAEKLSGPNSNLLLTDDTLDYLLTILESEINKEVVLFSIIALEKFAKTNENKEYIKNKLKSLNDNPLLRLEAKYADVFENLLERQIGFCARWCLDNYFCVEGRQYTYETMELSHINAMLNVRDVSEYLKISPDGLEARCDEYSFESVRCTFQMDAGCWYYEVLIVTPGVMQIGWATKRSSFLSHEGYGIGDDQYSISFDGCRRLVWYNAKCMSYGLPSWKSGSILGCLLNIDEQEIIFTLDGQPGAKLNFIFDHVKTGFFAAASFMSFQQCRFNFGTESFKYPPLDCNFQTFNDVGTILDRTILPKHLYLEQLRKSSIKENSCTICFDVVASVRIEPCKHRGYCNSCAKQLIDCPMCRGRIVEIVPDEDPS